MTNCIFGWENWGRTGTLAASSQTTGLEITQLQNDLGATSTSWLTGSGVTTAFFTIDAGTTVDWGAFGLFNTNLTPTATVRWRVGASTSVFTSDSGTLSNTVAAGYRQSLFVPTTAYSGRYARCDIVDTSNSEGRIRVAQLFAGRARRPSINLGVSTGFSREFTTPSLITRGGQEYPFFRFSRRSWNVVFPQMSSSDVWNIAQELHRVAGEGGNALFVPFPTETNTPRDAVFGRVTEAGPATLPHTLSDFFNWSVTFTERL
jgi:hypothetical protein